MPDHLEPEEIYSAIWAKLIINLIVKLISEVWMHRFRYANKFDPNTKFKLEFNVLVIIPIIYKLIIVLKSSKREVFSPI